MYQSPPLSPSHGHSIIVEDDRPSELASSKPRQHSVLPPVEFISSAPHSISEHPTEQPIRSKRSFRTVVLHDLSPSNRSLSPPQSKNSGDRVQNETPLDKKRMTSPDNNNPKSLGILAPSIVRNRNSSGPLDNHQQAPSKGIISSPPLKPAETSMKARSGRMAHSRQSTTTNPNSVVGFRSFSRVLQSPDDDRYSLFQSITDQLQQRNAELISLGSATYSGLPPASSGAYAPAQGNGMMLVKRTSMSQLKRADSLFSASSAKGEDSTGGGRLPLSRKSTKRRNSGTHDLTNKNAKGEESQHHLRTESDGQMSTSTLSTDHGSASDTDNDEVMSVGTDGSKTALATTRTYVSQAEMKRTTSSNPAAAIAISVQAPPTDENNENPSMTSMPPKPRAANLENNKASSASPTKHQLVRQRIQEAAMRRQEEVQRQLERTREKTELAKTKKVLAENTRSNVVAQAWWTIFTVTNTAAKIHDLIMRKKAMRFLMFRLLPRVRIKVRRLRCAKALKARLEAEGTKRLARPTTKMLRSDELLRLFPEDVLLELLPRMQARFYFKNDVVCYQGSAGAEAYIVVEGEGVSTVYLHSSSKKKRSQFDEDDENEPSPGIIRVDSVDSLSSVASNKISPKKSFSRNNAHTQNSKIGTTTGTSAPLTLSSNSFARTSSSKVAVESITRLKTGSLFGSPSLILGEKRMSTFKAASDMVVWVVQREDFLTCVAAGQNQDLLKRAMGMVRALHCSNISTLHSKAFSPEGLQKFEIFSKVDKTILQSISNLTHKSTSEDISLSQSANRKEGNVYHNKAPEESAEAEEASPAHMNLGEAPEPMLFQPGTALISSHMRAITCYLLLSGSVDVCIKIPAFNKFSHALFFALRAFTEIIQFTKRTNLIYVYDSIALAVEKRFKPLEDMEITFPSIPSPVLVGVANMITGVRHGDTSVYAATSCDAIRIPREPFIRELLEDFQSLPGTKNYIRRHRLSFFSYWYLRATQLPRSDPIKLLPVKEANRQIYGGGGGSMNYVPESDYGSPLSGSPTSHGAGNFNNGNREPTLSHHSATRVLSVYKNMSSLFQQDGEGGQNTTPVESSTKPSIYASNPRPLSPTSAAAASALAQFNANPFPNGVDELILDKSLADEAFIVVRGSFGPATGTVVSKNASSDDLIGTQPYLWPPLQQVFYGGYQGCSCKIMNPVTVVRIRRRDIHKAIQNELDAENRTYLQSCISDCAAKECGGSEPEIRPFLPTASSSPVKRLSGQSIMTSQTTHSPHTTPRASDSPKMGPAHIQRSDTTQRRPAPPDSPQGGQILTHSRVGKQNSSPGVRRVSFPADTDSNHGASARGDYPESLIDGSQNNSDSPQNFSIASNKNTERNTFDEALLLRGNDNDPRHRGLDWVPPPVHDETLSNVPRSGKAKLIKGPAPTTSPPLAVTAVAIVAESLPTGAKNSSPQWTPRRAETMTNRSKSQDRSSVVVDPRTNNVLAVVGPSPSTSTTKNSSTLVLSGRRAGDGIFTYDTLTELLRDHVPSSSPYNMNNMAAAQRKALIEGTRPHYDLTDTMLKAPSKPKTKLTMEEAGRAVAMARQKEADARKRKLIKLKLSETSTEYDEKDEENEKKQQASATDNLFSSQFLEGVSGAPKAKSGGNSQDDDVEKHRRRLLSIEKERAKLKEMLVDPKFKPVGELAKLLCDMEDPTIRSPWATRHPQAPSAVESKNQIGVIPKVPDLKSKISNVSETVLPTLSPRAPPPVIQQPNPMASPRHGGKVIKQSQITLSSTHQRPLFVFDSPPSESAIAEAFSKGSPGAFAFKSSGAATRKRAEDQILKTNVNKDKDEERVPQSSRGVDKPFLPIISTSPSTPRAMGSSRF